MPPVLEKVQPPPSPSPPPAQGEGVRLRRAYERGKRAYSKRDVNLAVAPDLPKLIDAIRRLKGVRLRRRGEEQATGARRRYVDPKDIPVPADDPTLINHFYGVLAKMTAGSLPSRRMQRPPRPPSHGMDT